LAQESNLTDVYSIREATESDVDLLIDLWHELDQHVKTKSNDFEKLKKSLDYHQYINKWIFKYLTSSDALLLSVDCQEGLCGFISTQIQYMPWYKIQRTGLIGPCYIKPLYRRRGIATRLVEQVEQWLIEKQVKYIDVIWDQGNSEAEKFWTTCGYNSAQVRATKLLNK